MIRGEHGVGARVSPQRSGRRRAGIAKLTAALLALAFLPAFAAAPAGAVLARIGGHDYGVTPIKGVNPASLPAVKRAVASAPASTSRARPYDKAGQLLNHGGPVMHSVDTHVIYWDPSGEFTALTKSIVNKFFSDVARDSGLASNVFAVAGQYGGVSGHALYNATFGTEESDATAYPMSGCIVPAGADTGPPYTHCITDAQLTSELSAYIAAHGLPKGPAHQYFVLLPHRVVTCLPDELVEGTIVHPCSNNYYCAYHSAISGGSASEIIYSDMPFSLLDSGYVKGCQYDGNAEVQHPNGDNTTSDEATKYADVLLKVISHEYIEAATDPLGDAWWDVTGAEIGDKCNTTGTGPGEDLNAFLPNLGGNAMSGTLFDQSINSDHFYLQSEWDNAAGACRMQPLAVSAAAFSSSPAEGVPHSPVTFQGTASDPYGNLELNWSFGDGATGTGAAPTHSYAASGSYEVTMTASDRLTGSTSGPVVDTFVVDEPPTGSFTFAPSGAASGTSVAFDGSASGDLDGSITGYTWSFGDGATGSGATIAHSYALPGQYTVTLTVIDSSLQTASASQSVTVTAPAGNAAKISANSAFTSRAAFNAVSGAITLTLALADPGTLSWLGKFPNGRFGVFAASTPKCRSGQLRLGARCRPASIVFASGRRSVAGPGTVTVVLKPSRSTLKALRTARKHRTGVPVSLTLRFQSARGGGAVIHTRVVVVRLKR
jgi:PKD repeat protein